MRRPSRRRHIQMPEVPRPRDVVPSQVGTSPEHVKAQSGAYQSAGAGQDISQAARR